MILDALPFALLALGVGVALASAPGPVQAVIVTEAARGGLRRGFDAVLGASATFAALLAAIALGFSMASPEGRALDLLRVVGGGWLLWLAWDGARSVLEPTAHSSSARSSMTRGVLSVVVNPGAWLFVAAVAAPLLASAGVAAGLGGALLVAAALAGGAASGDVLIVLASALGLRTLSERGRRVVNRVLHLLLGGVGSWLLIAGLVAIVR